MYIYFVPAGKEFQTTAIAKFNILIFDSFLYCCVMELGNTVKYGGESGIFAAGGPEALAKIDSIMNSAGIQEVPGYFKSKTG